MRLQIPWRLPFLLMLCLSHPAIAAGDRGAEGDAPLRKVLPVFSQLIALSVPGQFRPALENTTDTRYLSEWVPVGQSRETWSEMLTVSGTRGMANQPNITTAAVGQYFARGFQKDCPSSFSGGSLGRINLPGAEAFGALMSCGTALPNGAPYSETALVIVIKGSHDIYTIQWAERGAASRLPLVLDQEKWVKRLKALAPIRLCDRVDNESAPYPSCLNAS